MTMRKPHRPVIMAHAFWCHTFHKRRFCAFMQEKAVNNKLVRGCLYYKENIGEKIGIDWQPYYRCESCRRDHHNKNIYFGVMDMESDRKQVFVELERVRKLKLELKKRLAET